MPYTYLTTQELAGKNRYDALTVRNPLDFSVMTNGVYQNGSAFDALLETRHLKLKECEI